MSSKNNISETKLSKPLFLYMLIGISILLDFLGIITLILSFVGVGFVLSFITDFIGSVSSFILNNTQRLVDIKWALDEIAKLKNELTVVNKGGGKKGSNISGSIISKINEIFLQEKIKSLSMGILITMGATVIELIPLLGDISPTYTLATIALMVRRRNGWNKFVIQINLIKNKIQKFKGSIMRGGGKIGSATKVDKS